MAQIGTLIHKALADPYVKQRMIGEDDIVRTVPHLVIDQDVMPLMGTDATLASIDAMWQCGVLKLPYEYQLIEIWRGRPWRLFCLVAENRDEPQSFDVAFSEWCYDHLEKDGWMHFSYHPDHTPGEDLRPDDNPLSFMNTGDDKQFVTKDGRQPIWRLRANLGDETPHEYVLHIMAGVMAAILTAHIQGVEYEEPEVERLNKQRAKLGKVTIPHHTVVRLGHYFDRSGKRHAIHSGARPGDTPTGRTMPIHLRAGYVRNQIHGKQWLAANPDKLGLPNVTETHHPEWIKPVLVNYVGDEAPMMPQKVIRA